MADKIPQISVALHVLTLLILETEYSGLFGQYYGCWCPGELRSQGISRYGIDNKGKTTYRFCCIVNLTFFCQKLEQLERLRSEDTA